MKPETIQKFLDYYGCETCAQVIEKIAINKKIQSLEKQANMIGSTKYTIYNFIKKYATPKQRNELLKASTRHKKNNNDKYKENPLQTAKLIHEQKENGLSMVKIASDMGITQYFAWKVYNEHYHLIVENAPKFEPKNAQFSYSVQEKKENELNRFFSIHFIGSNPATLDKYKNY
jgi:hypothetical protein